jgi:hypothetical protein
MSSIDVGCSLFSLLCCLGSCRFFASQLCQHDVGNQLKLLTYTDDASSWCTSAFLVTTKQTHDANADTNMTNTIILPRDSGRAQRFHACADTGCLSSLARPHARATKERSKPIL